jgi:hypothetical protein
MITLSSHQKQLIFDYCVGLTSETETAEVTQLLSSNEQAANLHAKLKAALSPLDSLEAEPCPDQLVEGTIWRLNNLARSSQLRLQQLLAEEQANRFRRGGPHSSVEFCASEVLAAALPDATAEDWPGYTKLQC